MLISFFSSSAGAFGAIPCKAELGSTLRPSGHSKEPLASRNELRTYVSLVFYPHEILPRPFNKVS